MSGFCNICGREGVDTIEFGAMKSNGSSGSIGMGICPTCRDVVEWHDENGGGQCASCGGNTPNRTIQLHQPGRQDHDLWSAEIELCSECYKGGLMHMHESEAKLRARANIESEWDQQRRKALARDSYECQTCGVDGCRLHVHHKIPRSEGGTDHLENLVTLCPDCHADRHDKHSCMLCGSITDEHGTWFDRNGGLAVWVCEECQQYIKRGSGSDRCSICARFTKDGTKSRGIGFWSDNAGEAGYTSFAACESCRVALPMEPWPSRQEYVDEELPDSHVNVRHWEGSDD